MDEGCDIIHRAYVELSTCRSIGMGVGPIPFVAMLEWCRLYELSPAMTRHLTTVLMMIDADFLRRQHARSKPKSRGDDE